MHFIPVRIECTDSAWHMMLDAREHDTDALDCWCNPAIQRPCHECHPCRVPRIGEGDPNEPNVTASATPVEGCWACERGWVTVDRWEADGSGDLFLVIHNSK